MTETGGKETGSQELRAEGEEKSHSMVYPVKFVERSGTTISSGSFIVFGEYPSPWDIPAEVVTESRNPGLEDGHLWSLIV